MSQAQAIRLIIGLGNPGSTYQQHRHNIGVQWVEQLCKDLNLSLSPSNKLHAHEVKLPYDLAPENSYLAHPTTYMNESGYAAAALSRFYKIPPEQIIVIHDELDLLPGQMKLKQGGGHAGHNGLRDIINKLGSKDFWRLRIGIGHPGHKDQVSSYVLHKPSASERQTIDQCIQHSCQLLPKLLQGQFDTVAQQLAAT